MQDREKQIEEMARVMCAYYGTEKCYDCRYCCDCHIEKEAERLYNAGYRKQSEGEWISIEERLPEPYTWVTVYNPNGKYTKIDTDEIVGGNWVRNCGKVTHWMPLPEPPDMKGGE